jgi:Cu-processing system permease protein
VVVDAAVVAAVGMAMATLSTVAIMPLAVGVAFAIGGKALGATVDYLGRGADGDVQLTRSMGPVIDVVRWMVPDLARLDWRHWPMYGLPPGAEDVALAVLMGLAYIVVMLAIGIMAFGRREFS